LLNSTINRLPDDVLLEIFDFYRQGINPYYLWKKKLVWLILTHVCREWRAVIFASSFRLDLDMTVGPETLDIKIKMILSGSLPILINYKNLDGITESALWRLRAALKHHNRVRQIALDGSRGKASAWFDEFFKETSNSHFPVLESLLLRPHQQYDGVSLASVSGILMSATALTDLSLRVDTAFGPSPETSLLACLQGTTCLRSLDLSISHIFFEYPLQPSTPEYIISLSKLTRFRYDGHCVFLSALVAGLSAPSAQDVDISFADPIRLPIVHLPRFINEIKEHYRAVHVTFRQWLFHVSLLTQSEYIGHYKLRFNLGRILWHNPESVTLSSGAFSTRLATVEELRVTFDRTVVWVDYFPWREFLQHFPCVKALRTEGASSSCIASILPQDHEGPGDDLAFLPALEEIELDKKPSVNRESQLEPELAAFQPFVSARQQAGHPVKVFFRQ
jgi:hypothetical protein